MKALVLLLLLALPGQALRAQSGSGSGSALIFPRFVSNQNLTSGLAVFNPSGGGATATLTLRNTNGDFLTNATIQVPAYGQAAMSASELFPGLSTVDGSVLLTSTTNGLVGYYLTYNGQVTVIDGSSPSSLSNQLLFPIIAKTSEGTSEISIHNPNGSPTGVALSLWSSSGVLLSTTTLQIPAGGLYHNPPQSIFPSGTDFSQASHITAVSQPINIFSQAQTISGTDSFSGFSSLPTGDLDIGVVDAQPLSLLTNTGVIPYFRTGSQYASTISLANVEPAAVTVTLTAVGNSGSTLGTKTITIPGAGGLRYPIQGLFSILGSGEHQGWILVQSSGRVHATILFGKNNGGALSAVPIQPLPMTNIVFPQVLQGSGNSMEISMVNSGSQTAYATVHVVLPSGVALATNQIAIQPGARIAEDLSQLMPEISSQSGGYVFVEATQPIFSAASIWINNETSVANFVPQAVIASYQAPQLTSFAVTGNVTLNGAPIQGLQVVLSGPVGALATSDATGVYAFTGLPAGNYSMAIDESGSNLFSMQINFAITTASIRQDFQGYTAPNAIAVQPGSLPIASPDTTVDVFGQNFTAGSVVLAGAVRLQTTFVGSTHLTAVIPAYMLVSPAQFGISVQTGSLVTQSCSFIAYQDKPTLESITTAGNIMEGNPGTSITLQGTGFLPGLTVNVNGLSDGISVTLVDSTKVIAFVPASYFQQGGIFPVAISNPLPSNAQSNIQLLTVYYPSPEIQNAWPEIQNASPGELYVELEPGSGPVNIEIDGFGFRRGAVALFQMTGSSSLTPLYTSYCEDNAYCLATKLFASIPANLLQESGFGQIMIQNPSPTLASSGTLFLKVDGLIPTITGVIPGSATIYTTDTGVYSMPVIVNGTNFGPQTTFAAWQSGSKPPLEFGPPDGVLSSTQLYFSMPVNYPDSLGTWNVWVMNPSPGGGTSPAAQFTLTGSNFDQSPFLVSMNPTTVAAGGPGFTLTLTGTNFATGASVQFYTTLLPATVINSTLVTVQIPAYLIASAGRFPVTLINPDGGGASNRLSLDVR